MKMSVSKIAAFLLLCLALPCAALAADIQTLDNGRLKAMLEENKGKVIMLNFFATWCPPCRVEIPEIVKLRSEFPEKKLVIIGLSVDGDQKPVGPFLSKLNVNYPVYMAAQDVTDALNITSVPHNTFIAPDGGIVVSAPGIAELPVLKELVSGLVK